MQIEITQKFAKQVDKCNDGKIRKRLSEVIKNILISKKLTEIKNLKKLKGHHNIFRIRMGNYRIGIFYKN